MHRPTYIALIGLAGTWGAFRLIGLWFSNQLLFAAGVAVFVITAYGAVLQSLRADTWELDWLKFYTIPLGLLAAGELLGLQEMQSEILTRVGYPSLPSIIPGSSDDYPLAVRNHFLSMVFPLLARGVAGAVGALLGYRERR